MDTEAAPTFVMEGWEVARTRSGRKTHLRPEGGQTASCGVRAPIRTKQDAAPTCESCWAGAATSPCPKCHCGDGTYGHAAGCNDGRGWYDRRPR